MADIEKIANFSPTVFVEKSVYATAQVDAALAYLRQEGEHGTVTEIDETKFVRKIDWMIVPLMWMCYFLQYLDKTLINYANVMGLQADTGTSASQFSYLALAFYVSYLAFEIPQGYLMQRFPTAKYLGIQVICWGQVERRVRWIMCS